MTEPAEQARSREACPICGAHRLALERPPRIDVIGVQPYLDLIAMGDVHPQEPPSINCLQCGTSWPNLEAFEVARHGG